MGQLFCRGSTELADWHKTEDLIRGKFAQYFGASPTKTKHFRASPGKTQVFWGFAQFYRAKPQNAWVLLGEAPKSVRKSASKRARPVLPEECRVAGSARGGGREENQSIWVFRTFLPGEAPKRLGFTGRSPEKR